MYSATMLHTLFAISVMNVKDLYLFIYLHELHDSMIAPGSSEYTKYTESQFDSMIEPGSSEYTEYLYK